MKRELKFYLMTRTKPLHIMSRLETAERIARGNSICRFGDGEFGLLFGNSIGFQHSDEQLRSRLEEILRSAGEKTNNMLICIPGGAQHVDNMLEEPRQFWMNWCLQYRVPLAPYLNGKYVYGDSLVTRLWLAWKDRSKETQIVEKIKETVSGRNIIIVEGKETRFGDGNNLLDACCSLKRIICPAKNAFDRYNEILSCCKQVAQSKKDLFVCALGPTATVLAFDLCQQGYQALDMGHLDLQYEFLMCKASERIDVAGKANNELHKGETAPSHNEIYGSKAYWDSVCKVIE